MKQIKIKLQRTFISVIVIFVILFCIFFYFNFNLNNKQKSSFSNLILLNDLNKNIPAFVEDYHNFELAPKSIERKQNYVDTKEKILNILINLESNIKYKESIIVFRGLNNMINHFITRADENIIIIEQKKKSNENSDTYDILYQEKNYISENINLLINHELSYFVSVNEKISYTNYLIGIIFFPLLVIVIVVSLIYTIKFSSDLTKPIESLVTTAKKISEGNFSARSNIKTDDEIKELSVSFNEMALSLDKNMEIMKKEIDNKTKELKELNSNLEKKVEERTKQVEEAKKELEKKNKELEQTMDYFYTLRINLANELKKGQVEAENKKIKKKLDNIKKKRK